MIQRHYIKTPFRRGPTPRFLTTPNGLWEVIKIYRCAAACRKAAQRRQLHWTTFGNLSYLLRRPQPSFTIPADYNPSPPDEPDTGF